MPGGPMRSNSCARHLLAPNDAHEIQHAETAAHTRHCSRGQHVVRSGDVVARGLWGELVEENGSRMLHRRGQRRWDCEMLRRDAIRHLYGLLERRGQQNRAATGKRLGCRLGYHACASGLRFELSSPTLARL